MEKKSYSRRDFCRTMVGTAAVGVAGTVVLAQEPVAARAVIDVVVAPVAAVSPAKPPAAPADLDDAVGCAACGLR